MERQTSECIKTQSTAADASSDLYRPPSEQQLSDSLPILRFPKPQGSQYLANWVSNSASDIKQPPNMSDSNSLADSAYEIINGTDSESQDGRLTESTGSLSVSRPDDVHSLDGSEAHYNSDSDEESDHSSHASSIRYADQALQNPSTQPPMSSLEYGSATEGSGVVVRSIEFQEGNGDGGDGSDGQVLLEKISVKHTIREFTEVESSALAQSLDLPDAPKRLVATIRQTMSQAYLSTKEPLKLLYVGRPDAQRSIVLKICSAIWVSPKNGAKEEDYFNRHREGVYNIVPISSFGPSPELELMEASPYQIRVDHCTAAEEIIFEGASFPNDTVYSITVGNNKSYLSLFSPSGSVVQPKWDLPNIAIFYCSDEEDTESQRTRDAAWAFMNRHGVPSIFITERQSFGKQPAKRWAKYVNEHTVHMCLESRDPERPMAPQRFPIDHSSFVDIDARQMNRNLAYLAGLTEPEEPISELETSTFEGIQELGLFEASEKARRAWAKFLDSPIPKQWLLLAFIAPILMSLIVSLLTMVFPASPRPGNSSQTSNLPHSLGVSMTSHIPTVATSTTTVVINVTSTRTVQVSQAKPTTSTLASALSFAGLLSDRPLTAPVDHEIKKPVCSAKKTTCSVHIHGPTELLVAIPGRNRALWLAHGAIDIDVYRGTEPLKTKLSSVDEGVLVELAAKDAYGILNVSVVTSRRPKINETFEVDFGKSAVSEAIDAGLQIFQGAIQKVSARFGEASQLVEDTYVPAVSKLSAAFGHALAAARDHRSAVRRATSQAREHIVRQLESAEKLRKGVDVSILQAQIASRLWYLKMQGRMEEYAEYQRKASEFLKLKYDELARVQKVQEKKGSRLLFGMRHGSCWSCKRDSGGGGQGVKEANHQDRGRDNRWKKMILGGD